jgi:RNA polymerase sigma-32 factor
MGYLDDGGAERADRDFIRNAMGMPLLEREQEFDLARRWREAGDTAALHELVRAYTRLVISTAGRYRNYGLPSGDLVQEGNVGLMQAAARFEPDREVRFSTYATWWIRAAMQDYVLRNWSIVRTGTTAAQKSLFFNLRRLRARIEEANGGPMGDAGRREIAEKLSVDLAEVENMEQRLAGADQSLNTPIATGGEEEWQDFLPDQRPSPEEVVIGMRDASTRSKWLAQAIAELSPRERAIITQRRLTEQGATLEELGREMGVSKERVRQLESRALQKLLHSMTKHGVVASDLA